MIGLMRPLVLRIGVDEAGRGPLAGPVSAAAVALPAHAAQWGLTDSKALSEKRRMELELIIKAEAICWAVGWATSEEVDAINILQATMLAMRRAIAGCGALRAWVLIDGNRCPQSAHDELSIIKGDLKVLEISAASILAKQARDTVMRKFDVIYPGYGFAVHMGYPTPAHRLALKKLGPTPIHRRSFAPVREALGKKC